jgi:hypothetical protein
MKHQDIIKEALESYRQTVEQGHKDGYYENIEVSPIVEAIEAIENGNIESFYTYCELTESAEGYFAENAYEYEGACDNYCDFNNCSDQ